MSFFPFRPTFLWWNEQETTRNVSCILALGDYAIMALTNKEKDIHVVPMCHHGSLAFLVEYVLGSAFLQLTNSPPAFFPFKRFKHCPEVLKHGSWWCKQQKLGVATTRSLVFVFSICVAILLSHNQESYVLYPLIYLLPLLFFSSLSNLLVVVCWDLVCFVIDVISVGEPNMHD